MTKRNGNENINATNQASNQTLTQLNSSQPIGRRCHGERSREHLRNQTDDATESWRRFFQIFDPDEHNLNIE